MAFKPAKYIATHPGVKECDSAEEGGAPDYTYDVLLKEGWRFKRGRMAGTRCGFFKSVADFKHAEPERALAEEEIKPRIVASRDKPPRDGWTIKLDGVEVARACRTIVASSTLFKIVGQEHAVFVTMRDLKKHVWDNLPEEARG